MKTNGALSSLLLLAALTTGCGSSDSGMGGSGGSGGSSGGSGGGAGGAGGKTGGSGGKAGGGNGGAGAVDPGGPLLDRPAGDKYDCSVSRPITLFDLPWAGFSLVPSAEGAELAIVRADHNNPDPNRPGNSITWSTLSLDGTLGAPNAVRAPTNQHLANVTAARGGEKSTIIWSEAVGDGNSYTLNSLQMDAAGAVVTPANVLLTLARAGGVEVVRAGSGYALLWVDGNESSAKLSFGLLDDNGKLASTPVVVAQGPYLGVGNIAAVGEHFVVSYADYQHSDSGLVGRLVVLDSDGSVLGEPVALEDSAASGFSATVPSLLVRGDQVLAAWSVVSGDSSYDVQDAATTVRIARFDADGQRQGLMYDLQAPVKDRESVQASWVDMGDDVGLLWAEGSIIYVCAGCVPDHSLKLVVLDGQDFSPQSNAVELANTLPSGGLLSPETARNGDDLLVVSTVTYHTSAEGASGTIRCAQ
jgi:hypothetical protein